MTAMNGQHKLTGYTNCLKFSVQKNLTITEKRLNIQAGNGYFERKKDKYKESQIAVVKDLAAYPKSDWNKEDIEERESKFKGRIVTFLKDNLNLA